MQRNMLMAENETTQAAAAAAASDNDHARPLPPAANKLLDPQLLMAARRGDSDLLKELLQLKKDEDGSMVEAEAAAATSEVVIVDVVPPRRRSAAPTPAAAARTTPSPPATSASPSPVDGVTMEGDTLLHVVAASDDTQEYLDCAKIIVHHKKRKGGADAARLALEARNKKRDTPLHCAAGAGNANMIGCLVDLVANTADDDEAGAAVKKAFLRTQNEVGETALHQAVRAANNKVACIDRLMAMDPELACIPRDDEDGASPLYLAISLGEVEIAQHLYSNSEGKLSYSGPDGRNVLHAAVHRAQALPMVLKWLKDMKPKDEDSSSFVPLVSRLSSQRDRKQKGSTPLHLAASLGRWPGLGFLSRRFPEVWPRSQETARLLLNANKSTAYQADDEGSYPIHVAAACDSLGVVKLLLERFPDCATLRDGKARTLLHVAAEKERLDVVRYVVSGKIMPQRLSSLILNAQDNNGDTALHGAVRAGNLAVFNCLFRNQQVRLDVANKDGMTPVDLSLTMMIPAGLHYTFNPRSIVHRSLLEAGAPHGGGRRDLFFAKHASERDLDKESKKHTELAQGMSIVTALIATVTFASAFTFPGGYRADDGEPVLARSYAFHAFILADTLAFICSILATFSLVYAGAPAMDIFIRFRNLNLSTDLMHSAVTSLVTAFGLGLYLVLAPIHHTASSIAACAIVFASTLYGNIELWQIIRTANMVLARTGSRQRAAVGYRHCTVIFFRVFIHFWSYVIIFGLPAIRKRVNQKQF